MALFENVPTLARSESAKAQHGQILQCKILRNAGAPDVPIPSLVVDLPGDIPMKVNDKAPDFTLQDENGKEIALQELRGKTVVLYFYPRADTPG